MHIEDRLKGRVALITGAGVGIGAAIARRFAAEGAAVALLDIDAANVKKVAAEIVDGGGNAIGLEADVADRAAVDAAVAKVVKFGGGEITVVVNNAGIIRPGMFDKMTPETFALVLSVHLGGTFNCSQAALPYLPEDGRGRIINTTSAAGLTGTIGQANYSTAKAGMVGLTKSLAKELGRKQITANVVSPMAATEMTETIRTDPRFKERYLDKIVLHRWASPEEVAGTWAFLASDDGAYITGQVICVDGGTVV